MAHEATCPEITMETIFLFSTSVQAQIGRTCSPPAPGLAFASRKETKANDAACVLLLADLLTSRWKVVAGHASDEPAGSCAVCRFRSFVQVRRTHITSEHRCRERSQRREKRKAQMHQSAFRGSSVPCALLARYQRRKKNEVRQVKKQGRCCGKTGIAGRHTGAVPCKAAPRAAPSAAPNSAPSAERPAGMSRPSALGPEVAAAWRLCRSERQSRASLPAESGRTCRGGSGGTARHGRIAAGAGT